MTSGGERRPWSLRLTMRVKLLAGFSAAFTVVFLVIAVWVVHNATKTANDRLVSELVGTAEGGARAVNADELALLVANVPAKPDPANPSGLGYPDSGLYSSIARQLMDIRQVVPQANPYTYFRSADDDQLYFAVSAGYYYVPQFGVTFKEPVSEVSGPQTAARMAAGLERTTVEPPYTDDYGSWISAYSPIRNAQGVAIGAIGIDYPTEYVQQVQRESVRALIPVLLASYAALLLLVLAVSTAFVRPVRRLTEASRRVADGDYDLDVEDAVRTHFPDELHELAAAFATMTSKVASRERSLTSEVQRLRVEIDEAKRQEAVEQITGTDFFADLEARAQQLRQDMHQEGDAP